MLHESLLFTAGTYALFSSIAALMGSAGQTNYSAANASLDTLAMLRRANGYTGVSIQWGAWADVGMAARGAANARVAAMEAASGLSRISLSQGLGALGLAVEPRSVSSLGMVPVQWQRMFADGGIPASFGDGTTLCSCPHHHVHRGRLYQCRRRAAFR